MSENDEKLQRLEKRIARERAAREEAERLLESKSRELFIANSELSALAQSLEEKVVQRTAELSTALGKAEAGIRAKTRFLAVMSHELRTPMNGIMGMSELLRQTMLTTSQSDLLASLQDSARGMFSLITDLLDLSALENGETTLKPEATDLSALLDSACSIHRNMANQRAISLWIEKPDKMPWVKLDANRLRQILDNLLDNAVKFSEQGEIRVSIDIRKQQDAQTSLAIMVEDQGIGMTPEQLSGLFETFSMGDDSSTRRHGGTGMGLAISRHLVQLMGGQLLAESRYGEGSRFTLQLQVESCSPPITAEAAITPFDDPAIHNLQILVAEDNPLNQKLISKMLEKLGSHHILLANNGVEAVNAVHHAGFDLILMDMQMPEMDGLQATREIRQLPLPRQPLIVALTANAFEEDKEACFAAGMDDFLAKPVSLPLLLSALGKAAKRHELDQPPPPPRRSR